jgi:uncharacterized membrane protein YbaN (DUF454 family)
VKPSPRKILLLVAGHGCVALAVAGAFLPLLPTTPFLLLASACYIRASEKHHRWLLENRVFGPILRDYQEKRGVTRRTKVLVLLMLWVSLMYSAYRIGALSPTPLALIFLASGITLSIVILRLRTVEAN